MSDERNAVVEDAVKRLASARHFHAGSIISMPVNYPSGSSVSVEVSIQNGKCYVSDMGGGHNEAEMLGALKYFKNEARRVAEFHNIKFDGHDVFTAEVPVDNIRGAIVVIANASAEAAGAALLKQAERNDADARDELYDRLVSVYKNRHIEKDAKLIGASNHQWRISVLVKDQARDWMFEPVSGHYINIVGTTAKFHDFAQMVTPPGRIAVIKSQEELGNYFGLISAASTKVVQMAAPDSTFIQLLEAA